MNTSRTVINSKKVKLPQKQKIKIFKKMKLAFFLRFFSLLIFIVAIIVSGIFSSKYIDVNHKLNIDFAGGYQTQVMYNGEATNQSDIIKMLEDRVDPIGSSNVNIENVVADGKNNLYNVGLSKDAGISMLSFVHNVARSGYFYIVDNEGNDLLATKKDKNTWTKREKRLLASDVFDKIIAQNNVTSHRPEINFNIKNTSILDEIKADPKNRYYIYSDIGQLLNYIRSTVDGILLLANVVDKVTDDKIKSQLTTLLDNNTPDLGIKGEDILQSAKKQDPVLINLLDINTNGQFGINWKYSDLLDAPYKLSVDTNDEVNTYDPANRFDPTASPIGSPVNAWLPYIKDLLRLSDISDFLNKDIINYRYAPYWIGEIKNPINENIIIQDDWLNFEKTQQIQNILTSGLSKNNFTLKTSQLVNPTLAANVVKFIIVILVIMVIMLIILALFYYRLLGLILLMVISLFLIFCIFSFTFINGIVGPEIVIALIICFALLFDTNINLLERFKNELKDGKMLLTAFKIASKKTLVSSLDCNIIIMIISLTIFWFGTRTIKGFAIMTSIATFGVVIFGIIILRLMLWVMLYNNWLENKSHWLGINFRKNITILNSTSANSTITNISHPKIKIISKFKPKKTKSLNQLSKWVVVASIVVLIVSGITYGAVSANFGTGFDTTKEFVGSASIKKATSETDYNITAVAKKSVEIIKDNLSNNSQYRNYFTNINYSKIAGGIGGMYQFEIIVKTNNNSSLNHSDFNTYLKSITDIWDVDSSVIWGQIRTITAKSGARLLVNMIIAIVVSFIIILIYIIIRFQLTYVIPLLLGIIFGLIMTTAIISMLQITISTSIVGVLLGVMILIVLSNMIIFDNINETKINNMKTKILTTSEIVAISNKSVKKALPRTLVINAIVIFSSLLIIFIIPSFWAVCLAMMMGCIVSLITCYFISPWLWIYFEKWRVVRCKKNLTKIKKHFIGADEYVIEGINELGD